MTLTGQATVLEVEDSDTVDMVKSKIQVRHRWHCACVAAACRCGRPQAPDATPPQDKEGILPERQTLVYAGDIMQGGHTLEDFDVEIGMLGPGCDGVLLLCDAV